MNRKTKRILTETANEYERLVNEDLIVYEEVTPEMRAKLPFWTNRYLQIFDDAKISYQISRTCLNGSFMFKLDDPVICFFEHHPGLELHQWVGPDYRNAVGANEALAYLAHKSGGVNQQVAKDMLDLVDAVLNGPMDAHELN